MYPARASKSSDQSPVVTTQATSGETVGPNATANDGQGLDIPTEQQNPSSALTANKESILRGSLRSLNACATGNTAKVAPEGTSTQNRAGNRSTKPEVHQTH